MKNIVLLSVCICCLLEPISTLFIIPEELLSVAPPIYSQFPTIHAGSDSRLGWGFRLGRYADFQILLELGPQTYTQPIYKNQKETGPVGVKRSTRNRVFNKLPSKNNVRKHRQIPKRKHEEFTNKERNYQTAAEWLHKWSEGVKRIIRKNLADSTMNTVSDKTEEKLDSNEHEKKKL